MPGLIDRAEREVKILALDLETSPNLAHVWGLWQQNVSIGQLEASTEVICFGGRWYGQRGVTVKTVHHDGKQAMLDAAWEMFDQADAIMGWNSRGFDVKHMQREFLQAGMPPPSPAKDLDLMVAVKAKFRFPSNKLDYVAQTLGVGKKVKHEGFEMWRKCLDGDDAAWGRMVRYQKQDVNLLIDLYEKLLPWLPNHPNKPLIDGIDGAVCLRCGSRDLESRGQNFTATGSYPRFRCRSCGTWGRGLTRTETSVLRPV
jgi:hypothetical protein